MVQNWSTWLGLEIFDLPQKVFEDVCLAELHVHFTFPWVGENYGAYYVDIKCHDSMLSVNKGLNE